MDIEPADVALKLVARGYHIIPLAHAQKAAVDRNWTKLRLTADDVEARWSDNPEYGVGLLLGTEVAPSIFLAAIDIDIEDETLIDRVRNTLPDAAPAKRGAKGITFICRTHAPLKKVLIKKRGEAIAQIEILAAGQQTVLPPSVHPKGYQYRWVGTSLMDYDPEELPILDQGAIIEIKAAVQSPDAKMFMLKELQPRLGDTPGNMHDSGVLAAASLVAFGCTDDYAINRILRAMKQTDKKHGKDDRDWIRVRSNVAELVKSARDEGFKAKDGKPAEAPDVTWAKWLINSWGDGACIYNRGGQLLVYKDGYYKPYSPEEFYSVLVGCGNEEIHGLGSRGWKLVTQTLIPLAPVFPKNTTRKVCLLNGTLDMDTGELAPWSKDDFLISQLDFEYYAKAKSRIYSQFVAETFAHDDEDETVRAVETFEEYVALTMFECHDFHRFLVLEGTTRSGKSVLCRVAQMMHSKTSISSVMAHDLNVESARTSMLGKLVNITGETSTVSAVADDYLKLIVAGDPVQVRHLYFGAYTTTLPTRLIIATNDPLRTKDTSGALMERMLAIPCDNYVPAERRDVHLSEKLEIERAGILNRMMTAWQRLRDRKKFHPPNSSKEMAEKFQADNNPVMQWINDRTHQGRMLEESGYRLPPNVKPYTEIKMLYLDYVEWAKSMGFMQMSVITFGMKLTQLRLPGIETDSKIRKLPSGISIRTRDLALVQQGRY